MATNPVWEICERMAEVRALLHDHAECGKHASLWRRVRREVADIEHRPQQLGLGQHGLRLCDHVRSRVDRGCLVGRQERYQPSLFSSHPGPNIVKAVWGYGRRGHLFRRNYTAASQLGGSLRYPGASRLASSNCALPLRSVRLQISLDRWRERCRLRRLTHGDARRA
jgi:hypothetical protein